MSDFFKVVGIILLIVVIALPLRMCNNAANVAYDEYSPGAMLKKYEYFKDLSSAIDKKRADIEMYKEQIKEETDKAERNQLKAELRGIVSMYNQLASDYNSQMSKFNYRFTNAGTLPESNLQPLPREYKPFILSLQN